MKTIIPTSLLIGLISWGCIYIFTDLYSSKLAYGLMSHVTATLTLSLLLLLWRFYRDPNRIPPESSNIIISPADGKILYIRKITESQVPYTEKNGKKFSLREFVCTDLLPSEGIIIGIAMNFLDVHVNRSPIDGKITFIKHIKGLFLSLKNKEAIIQNERVLTIIENPTIKIGVIQIASRLVRKIVPYIREGDLIAKGQKIGKIHFGSQVDLIIPRDPPFKLWVKTGEKVKAGTTIMASYIYEKS